MAALSASFAGGRSSSNSSRPSLVIVAVHYTSSWPLGHWQRIAARMAEHAAAGRRTLLMIEDTELPVQIEAALKECLDQRASLPALETLYNRLIEVLGIAGFVGHATLLNDAKRIAEGCRLLGETTPRSKQTIHEKLAAAFSTVLAEFFVQHSGLNVACTSLPDIFDTVGKGEGRLQNMPSSSTRAIVEWFAEFTAQTTFVNMRPLSLTNRADLLAAVIATCLPDTELVELWGSTHGFFTSANAIGEARLLKCLPYSEAREICSTQQHVCHPGFISLLASSNIPLQFRNPASAEPGTVVSHNGTLGHGFVKAVSVQRNQTLWSVETIDMWHTPGFMSKLFACFERHKVSVDLVATAETHLTMSLEVPPGGFNQEVMGMLQQDVCKLCPVMVLDNCVVVKFIGQGIGRFIEWLGQTGALSQSVRLITKAANDMSLSLVVDDADGVERKFHRYIFADSSLRTLPLELFGLNIAELDPTAACIPPEDGPDDSDDISVNKPVDHWWWRQRMQLVSMTPKADPIYVYDINKVSRQATKLLTKLKPVSRIFYALKANAHPQILQALFDAGVSFECVSKQEIEHVMTKLPSLEPSRILFTPNFAHRSEYQFALDTGVQLTIDSLHCLEMWSEMFSGRNVFLRIDPGSGHGHHAHVMTGGNALKFGVLQDTLPTVSSICEANNIIVVGLHCHSGSGIDDTAVWADHAALLSKVAKAHFPSVKFLNLGGGLGHPYKFGQKEVNLDEIASSLERLQSEYELWIEPGRFFVAGSGVILCRVTQLKRKGNSCYVGVTAGMNSLIRPSLYQSHHAIVNLSRADETGPTMPCTICGPICESGDVLGRWRGFPATTTEGDVVLIDSTGAYGRCMASQYNLRDPGQEHFL